MLNFETFRISREQTDPEHPQECTKEPPRHTQEWRFPDIRTSMSARKFKQERPEHTQDITFPEDRQEFYLGASRAALWMLVSCDSPGSVSGSS